MTKKTIPELSIDTRLLYQRLIVANDGDIIPYPELSKLIGQDVQGDGRGNLMSAIRRALNQDRAVFACVRGVGIKRLPDKEIIGIGEYSINAIRRASKRTLRKLSSVKDFAALDNDSKVRHNTYASMFGVISHVTKPKQIEAVENKVKEIHDALPLQRTLEAFRP